MNAPRHVVRTIALALEFTFAVVLVPVAPANYNLDWHAIDGGDVMLSTGGNVDLSSTIGRHDTGTTPAGGNFEIIGGSWPIGVETVDCHGDLDVDRSDLAQLLGNPGTTNGAQHEDADLDGDGDVDLSDLAAPFAAYGATCS